MLLDKSQIEEIVKIVKDNHNIFVSKNIGHEVIPKGELDELKKKYGESNIAQIEDFVRDGYFVGYLGGKDPLEKMSHSQLKKTSKPKLNNLEEYSIEHSKEVLDSYIQKLSQAAQTNVETLIREYNKKYKDNLMVNRLFTMALRSKEANKSVSQLATDMRDLTGDMARDWDRVAATEMTNIINTGMVDTIVKMNPETHPDEIIVFKRVVNDADLCRSCKRLHLENDGSTPKIYRLSQVLANGTNVGKKPNSWDMIINATHPYCRCSIVQLPAGFIFNEEGRMKFVGKEESTKINNKKVQ